MHDEYLQSLEDEEEYKDILAKIKLCTDALTVINDVKEGMMADTRNTIQDATNEKFFKLIRKSQSYGFIEISMMMMDAQLPLRLVHQKWNYWH